MTTREAQYPAAQRQYREEMLRNAEQELRDLEAQAAYCPCADCRFKASEWAAFVEECRERLAEVSQ